MSLAFSAVNANQRVVLIDADLRHPSTIYLTALGKAEGEATRTALLLKSIARHVNRSYWRDNSAAGCHRDRWHRLASRFSMNRGLRSAS
jgi:hypothetical protein